jgi:hypothetical protein
MQRRIDDLTLWFFSTVFTGAVFLLSRLRRGRAA